MAVPIQGNTQVSRNWIFNLTNWANISLYWSVQMERTIYLSEFRQLILTNVMPISHRLFCQSMNAFHNYSCKFVMLFSVVFHSFDWPPWNVRQIFTTCRRNTIWIDGFFRICLVFLLLRRVKKKRSSIYRSEPKHEPVIFEDEKICIFKRHGDQLHFSVYSACTKRIRHPQKKKDSVVLSQCDLFRKNKFDIA